MAAEVKATIEEKYPKSYVTCRDGIVYVTIEGPIEQEDGLAQAVRSKIPNFSGLQEIRVNVIPYVEF